jgi:hypothetical protein
LGLTEAAVEAADQPPEMLGVPEVFHLEGMPG